MIPNSICDDQMHCGPSCLVGKINDWRWEPRISERSCMYVGSRVDKHDCGTAVQLIPKWPEIWMPQIFPTIACKQGYAVCFEYVQAIGNLIDASCCVLEGWKCREESKSHRVVISQSSCILVDFTCQQGCLSLVFYDGHSWSAE